MIYSPAEDSFLLSKILKQEIPKLLKKNSELKVFEVGAGSGIQLEALNKLGIKKQNIFSCDINLNAIKHCRRLGFNGVHSDLFENISGKFDLIIFNPPYLPEDLQEPENSKTSTTGGEKGSEIINKFLRDAKKHLIPDGKIFLITSSLTRKINWFGYKKKIIAKKKLFFEELCVWEIKY